MTFRRTKRWTVALAAAMTAASGVVASAPPAHAAPNRDLPPQTVGVAPTKPSPPLNPGAGGVQRQGASRLVVPETTARAGATSASTMQVPDLCTRAGGGPAGTSTVAVDMSRTHATVREFGIDSAFLPADLALVEALQAPSSLSPAGVGTALAAYDDALPDVCAMPADTRALGPGRVVVQSQIAIVTPGPNPPPIPNAVRAVVIDLRDLPAVDNLADVLAATVAPALASPVSRPARWERGHFGPVDEVFLANNVYSTFVSLNDRPPIPATGRRDIPLVLLTSDRMPAAAVELAGALRLAGRASIVGPDLLSAAGEAIWRGVGSTGVLARTRVLDQLFRPRPPLRLPGQQARQDDPFDPTTASYRRDFSVTRPDTELVRVTVDGQPGTDVDLYLLNDFNGDGSFAFPDEVVAFSGSASADEQVELLGQPPLGRYQVWVHGFDVPSSPSRRFELDIDVASGRVWPDVIPADRASSGGSPADIVRDAQEVTRRPPAAVQGTFQRSFPAPVFPHGQVREPVTGKAEVRAGLVIAHGITRMFFPYFDVVGDGIDGRLAETLGLVDQWDGTERRTAYDILRRFGEVLHDGHQFVLNFGPPVTTGYLPVFLDDVGGRPAVRRSGVPDIHPGDTITAIDGRPIEEIYADEFHFTSTATPGYRFDVASRQISRISGPLIVTLADTSGTTRDVSSSR